MKRKESTLHKSKNTEWIRQVMIPCAPTSEDRVRELNEEWCKNNLIANYFAPFHLRETLTSSEIQRELQGVGSFIDGEVGESFSLVPIPSDELSFTLCLGVPQKAVGTNWLQWTTQAESHLVCVDVSDVGCMDALSSMVSQEQLLEDRGIEPGIWWVHQADIQNFLIAPEDYHVNLYAVKRLVLPLILGYVGYERSKLILQVSGLSLSEAQDPQKSACTIVIGQLQDNQALQDNGSKPRYDEHRKLWYYKREEVVRSIQKSAGRKVEVIREKTFTYFGEIVTALMIKAK